MAAAERHNTVCWRTFLPSRCHIPLLPPHPPHPPHPSTHTHPPPPPPPSGSPPHFRNANRRQSCRVPGGAGGGVAEGGGGEILQRLPRGEMAAPNEWTLVLYLPLLVMCMKVCVGIFIFKHCEKKIKKNCDLQCYDHAFTSPS